MEVFNKQILIDRETRLNIGISVTQEKNRFYETTKIFKSSRKIVKCQYSGEKVVQSIRFFTPAFKGLEQIGRTNLHSSENCFLHCSAELELILRLSTKIFNRLLMRLMANYGLSWMMRGEKQEMLRVNLNFWGDRSIIFPQISLMKLKHSWRNRKISKSDGRSDGFFMVSCFNSRSVAKPSSIFFATSNSSGFQDRYPLID